MFNPFGFSSFSKFFSDSVFYVLFTGVTTQIVFFMVAESMKFDSIHHLFFVPRYFFLSFVSTQSKLLFIFALNSTTTSRDRDQIKTKLFYWTQKEQYSSESHVKFTTRILCEMNFLRPNSSESKFKLFGCCRFLLASDSSERTRERNFNFVIIFLCSFCLCSLSPLPWLPWIFVCISDLVVSVCSRHFWALLLLPSGGEDYPFVVVRVTKGRKSKRAVLRFCHKRCRDREHRTNRKKKKSSPRRRSNTFVLEKNSRATLSLCECFDFGSVECVSVSQHKHIRASTTRC